MSDHDLFDAYEAGVERTRIGQDPHTCGIRAVADAARAPLLDEVERLQRENERLSDTSLWDGGTWDLEYESPDGSDGPYWSDHRWFDSTRQRRRWTGPPQPIEPAASQ